MNYISGPGSAAFALIFWIYVAISWIMNAIAFFNCDFESSYKDEIIHGIGLIVPPLSGITVWF